MPDFGAETAAAPYVEIFLDIPVGAPPIDIEEGDHSLLEALPSLKYLPAARDHA